MPPIIPDHRLQRDGFSYRVQPYISQFGFIDAVGNVGEVEGGGFEEGDEVGPGGVLVVLEANPSVVVAEVGVIGELEGGGLVLEVDDAVGVVGGGVAEVAEDHFDGAVLGIEAGGEVGGGEREEFGFPDGYEAADFGGVSGKWVHGRQVG